MIQAWIFMISKFAFVFLLLALHTQQAFSLGNFSIENGAPDLKTLLEKRPASKSQFGGSDPYEIAAAQTDRQLTEKALSLEVEFEDRPYFVGEPVWIRCSLVNATPDPIKIFYGLESGDYQHTLSLDVRDPEGKALPRIVWAKIDYAGPEIVTIPSGGRLVAVFSLLEEHCVDQAGEYQVAVRYQSNGQCDQRDPTTHKLVTLKATACNLKQELKTVHVVDSKQKVDQEAAQFLLDVRKQRKQEAEKGYGFSALLFERSTCQDVIKKFSNSRLAKYARFHEGLADLIRFNQTTNVTYASSAILHLESIDTSDCPKLFQEYVLFHLIEAHVYAESDKTKIDEMIENFRERFPPSPLLSMLK